MAVNKVEVNGETVLDLSQDSVTPEQLAKGATAHNAAGEQITGTYTAPVTSVNGQTGDVKVKAVLYEQQTLTDAQKQQTRENIGVVQPDWQQNDDAAPDYVQNRPGGYDRPGVIVVWGGVIGNRLTVPVSDTMRFVKVSGAVLAVDQINGSKVLTNIDSKFWLSDVTSDNVIPEGLIAFVSTPGWVNEGVTFPESGIYFLHATLETQTVFVTRLEADYVPDKIPQEYLELDNTLGITSATVGQIAKITAVDDSGKPTAWEAVDVESDNIVLASSTTGSTKKFRLTVDDSGTLSAVEVTDAS